MSVLIKVMKMPQNCRECRFMETVHRLDGRERYICIAHLNEITNLKERLDTCPLEEAPTIDAVPVVRCKDCKHWGMHKSLNIPWCYEMHIDKSEDGYCDSGERREDDTAN